MAALRWADMVDWDDDSGAMNGSGSATGASMGLNGSVLV